MSRRRTKELLTDVGIEIEFSTTAQAILARDPKLAELDMSVVHDASSETAKTTLRGGVIVNNKTKTRVRANKVKCGGEIVTSIWYNSPDGVVYPRLKAITEVLQGYGEPHKTKRCGIHFHINYSHNIDILHNLINLGSHLEKVFFTLGGMGYPNRGADNDAIYFRPITRKGPLVVPVGRGSWAQAFTTTDLLKAKTSDSFFERLGDMWNVGQNMRYFPGRYHWLNLCNLVMSKGTLEFRVFNTTLDALNIWAALQFSTAFARVCLHTKPSTLLDAGFGEENSVFVSQGKEKIYKTAENFCEFAHVDTKVRDLIMSILESTPEPTFEEYYTKSHLHTRNEVVTHWKGSKYKPKRIPEDEIKSPTYEDYYNTSNEGNRPPRIRRTPRPALDIADNSEESSVRSGWGETSIRTSFNEYITEFGTLSSTPPSTEED